MALYIDRVQETTTTTGTGTVTLAGAVTGYRSFSSVLSVGDRVRYCITDGTDWEVGDGTLASSSTFSRENVFASSNANALVNFAAGTKNIFVDLPADAICDVGLTLAIASLRHNQ